MAILSRPVAAALLLALSCAVLAAVLHATASAQVPAQRPLGDLTTEVLRGLEAAQQMGERGDVAGADAQLRNIESLTGEITHRTRQYLGNAEAAHRTCADRSAKLERELGGILSAQEDLNRKIADVDAQIAAVSSRERASGDEIRQLNERVSRLERSLAERRKKLRELEKWWWVPGYGFYLSIRTLAQKDIQEQDHLISALQDNNRMQASLRASLETANRLRSTLARSRDQFRANDEALHGIQRQIVEKIAKARAAVAFLSDAEGFWIRVQRLGVARTADDVLFVARQLEQQVSPTLAEEFRGSAQNFKEALIAFGEAVSAASYTGPGSEFQSCGPP